MYEEAIDTLFELIENYPNIINISIDVKKRITVTMYDEVLDNEFSISHTDTVELLEELEFLFE